MSFSKEWEQGYIVNTHLSIWPWSDLVSLVHRYCKKIISMDTSRILELGCGAGANIPLFHALQMNYFAIEGSATIVKKLHHQFPDLADNIRVGDFTREQPFKSKFDLIIDRASLTHNNTQSIVNGLKYVFDSLKPGGIFIGVDWFSKNHSDFLEGIAVDDEFTKTNIMKGQFIGIGKVHFSDEAHLRNLFCKFEILFIEEKLLQRYEPRDNHHFASWNIVAKKPYA